MPRRERAPITFRLTRVESARHVGGHTLWLRFDDGLAGAVDLADGIHGPFLEPLRDIALFAQARVVDGIVTWPNGPDWATEDLHQRLRAAKGVDVQSRGDGLAPTLAILRPMPEISRFYGIIIRMLADDHAPHFHAQYGEYEVTVTIRDGVVAGRFPGRALRLVLEWRDLHQAHLLANWERLRAGEPPQSIEPLS